MTEQIDVLEDQYLQRLAQFSAKWQVLHPEEAKAVRAQVAAEFKIVGQPDAEPGSLRWQIFEAAVNEAVRVKAGKPSVRAWLLDPKNHPPLVPPSNAPQLAEPKNLEREDRMKLASGEKP